MDTGLQIIITGASGMVGEGVLFECLKNTAVEKILVIGRTPCGTSHPKLREIIHKDFNNLAPIAEQMSGYDACFFCLGISSIGKNEKDFTAITYNITMHMAETLIKVNERISFCYVSGAGTDSSEKGKMMWARVKGKTENDLAALPFEREYNFRPAMLVPAEGQKNILTAYKALGWLAPVVKMFFPGMICTIPELGRAMIKVVKDGYYKSSIEVKDIKNLAK